MTNNKATRHRCNGNRAIMSTARDYESIAYFERTCESAGWLLGIAFGVMFAIGVVM